MVLVYHQFGMRNPLQQAYSVPISLVGGGYRCGLFDDSHPSKIIRQPKRFECLRKTLGFRVAV